MECLCTVTDDFVSPPFQLSHNCNVLCSSENYHEYYCCNNNDYDYYYYINTQEKKNGSVYGGKDFVSLAS